MSGELSGKLAVASQGGEQEGVKMFKQFAVVFGGGLEEFFAPRFFATEEEAVAEFKKVRANLKDPKGVQLMILLPLD